jgi:phosphatidylserine/phosphatidylglycerophosphate/cardiolipin synthase-like enzyme
MTGDIPRIRIAMARWTTRRPRILEEIKASLKRGCAVDLVLRFDPGDDFGVKRRIIDQLIELRNSGVFDDRLSVKLANGNEEKTNVHCKYFLVEGFYGDGDEWETNVWSGSENWTSPALNYNDEIMVKCRDAELHKLYVEHHKGLQSLCVDNPADIA